MHESERTQRVTPPVPGFQPETTQRVDITQKMDAVPSPSAPLARSSDPEVTQRIDDSIWRLQEAKRILQKITPK